MKSKTSFFNFTLYRKNVISFWPIWVVYLLTWIFLILVQITSSLSNAKWESNISKVELNEILSDSVLSTTVNPGFFICVAVGLLCAMASFHYLYQRRSIHFFHALPIRREGLFFTNYVSGLSFFLIPNVIILLISILVLNLNGLLNLPVLITWFLATSGICFFFYSFAVFCGMFTGQLLALPIFFGIINILYIGLKYLFGQIIHLFVYGFSFRTAQNLNLLPLNTGTLLNPHQYRRLDQMIGLEDNSALSPIYYFMKNLSSRTVTDKSKLFQLDSGSIIAGYAIAGVLLTLIAFLLHRKYKSEQAGELITISVIKPVFRWGLALCISLLLTILISSTYFKFSNRGIAWIAWIIMFVTGFVGYFIAEMLLSKSFLVFRKGLKGWLIYAATVSIFLLGMEYDLFGYEKKIPQTADIQRVFLYPEYFSNYIVLEPEATKALHQTIIYHKDQNEQFFSQNPFAGYSDLTIDYKLNNGDHLIRSYKIPTSKEELEDPSTLSFYYASLINQPDLIFQKIFPEDFSSEDFIDSEIYIDSSNSYKFTKNETIQLYQAIIKDIKNGTMGSYLMSEEQYDSTTYHNRITLRYYENQDQTAESENLSTSLGDINIYPTTTSYYTLDFLKTTLKNKADSLITFEEYKNKY